MREIKFNAVDEDTKEYVRFDNYIKSLKEPNGFGCIEFDEDKTDSELLADFLNNYFGYKLLQYTGLKDKNGVEIYEGDILRIDKLTYDNKNEFEPFNGEVEFYLGNFHLDVNKMLLLCYGEIVEIIGNIYENKGLLDE